MEFQLKFELHEYEYVFIGIFLTASSYDEQRATNGEMVNDVRAAISLSKTFFSFFIFIFI